MKKILTFLLFFCVCFGMTSCSQSKLERPTDTNLEFWIAENVDEVNFSKYQIKYGMFGGAAYYGLNYSPTLNENGEQVDPVYCVIYTVTAYPDYCNREKHVTSISITDPSVNVYGLTVESSLEEFDSVMGDKGFTIDKVNENYHRAVRGKFVFSMSEGELLLSVKVSNRFGIEF